MLLISQMAPWQKAMKDADCNGDGALSFLEFQDAIKMAEQNVLMITNSEENKENEETVNGEEE